MNYNVKINLGNESVMEKGRDGFGSWFIISEEV